jgi:hypothetical protein
MIGGPPPRFRHHALKIKLAEIKRIDKRVDYLNRIVLVELLVK